MCVLIVGKIASSANKEFTIYVTLGPDNWPGFIARSHGVMVNTLDSGSKVPSSETVVAPPGVPTGPGEGEMTNVHDP